MSGKKLNKISLVVLSLLIGSTQILAAPPTSSAGAPANPATSTATPLNANSTSTSTMQDYNLQFGTVRITFDYWIYNVAPMGIAGSNPSSWIAPVPQCPPGTTQVPGAAGGIQASQPVYDYGPGYPYYACFCSGNCNAASGYTLPGVNKMGSNYGAKVTCTFTTQGTFKKSFFSNTPGIPDYPSAGYRYNYCQRGGCPGGTVPIPAAMLGSINIPNSAQGTMWSPVTRIVFKACGTGAGLPDTGS